MILKSNTMEEKMKINKKVKCLHCGQTLECNEQSCNLVCSCGKVKLSGEIITEGVLGTDYMDVTPRLLNG